MSVALIILYVDLADPNSGLPAYAKWLFPLEYVSIYVIYILSFSSFFLLVWILKMEYMVSFTRKVRSLYL